MRDRAKAILDGLKANDRVTDPNDIAFLHSLLRNHPNQLEKIGVGFEAFVCTESWMFGGHRNFGVLRTDGSIEKFGWKQCLNPSSRRAIVHDALRTTIQDQSIFVWENYKRTTPENLRDCPITGNKVTQERHAIDHGNDMPFVKIADDFISEYRIDIAKMKLEKHHYREVFTWPSDPVIRKRFQDYHSQKAQLKVLSPEGNAIMEGRRREAEKASALENTRKKYGISQPLPCREKPRSQSTTVKWDLFREPTMGSKKANSKSTPVETILDSYDTSGPQFAFKF